MIVYDQLPKKNNMFHSTVSKLDDCYYALLTADAINIDEILMMTSQMMNLMVHQICKVCDNNALHAHSGGLCGHIVHMIRIMSYTESCSCKTDISMCKSKCMT